MVDGLVLIPFKDEFLALSPEQFHAAIERGRALMPTPSPTAPPSGDNRIVDAAGAAAVTGVPESWFLEQARQVAIPHLRFGRYVRFRISEMVEAVSTRQKAKHHNQATATITKIGGTK